MAFTSPLADKDTEALSGSNDRIDAASIIFHLKNHRQDYFDFGRSL